MEPRHAPLKTAPRRARKKRRVMKKEVASSSTTPSSVSVAAASDGEQPPLLVPVPAGAEAFEYERGKKDIFPKPGELVQVKWAGEWAAAAVISTDLEAKPPTFQVVALVSHDSEELPYYEDLNHKNEWRWIQCKDRDLGVVQLDPAAVTPSGVSTGQQQRHTTQGESVSIVTLM